MSSLEQAVYVWFESCIEREVKVHSRATPKQKAPAKQYVEVKVSAYIAAAHLVYVRPVDWKDLVKLCKPEGCTFDRQRGDHYVMTKKGIPPNPTWRTKSFSGSGGVKKNV